MTLLERFNALPPLVDDKIEVTDGMSPDDVRAELASNQAVAEVVTQDIERHQAALNAAYDLQTKLLRRRQVLSEAIQQHSGHLT